VAEPKAPATEDRLPTGERRSTLSDRVLGVVSLVLGLWYTVEARTFDGTAFSSGPVGPKTLPTGIGIMFCTLAAYLIVKPDPGPKWPTKSAAGQVALVIFSSYIYGQIIESVGFILSSAAMTMIIGLLFKAPPRRLLPLSLVFPIVLAFVFNNLLELQLPAGWFGGL
jgi:putative tricarboxylic transport membrane protein